MFECPRGNVMNIQVIPSNFRLRAPLLKPASFFSIARKCWHCEKYNMPNLTDFRRLCAFRSCKRVSASFVLLVVLCSYPSFLFLTFNTRSTLGFIFYTGPSLLVISRRLLLTPRFWLALFARVWFSCFSTFDSSRDFWAAPLPGPRNLIFKTSRAIITTILHPSVSSPLCLLFFSFPDIRLGCVSICHALAAKAFGVILLFAPGKASVPHPLFLFLLNRYLKSETGEAL